MAPSGAGAYLRIAFATSLEVFMLDNEPDFSDVEGGSSSTAPKPAGATYTVVKGDSLSKIAKRLYGDAQQWKQIYEANKDTIKNPDQIYPGQVLKIP
jgi:nucleoid-associated protein YgaU